MKYYNMKEALFLERPNRFIAYALLNGEKVKCHVKNTGRCKELLIPGESKVYLEDHGDSTSRKTRYSLVKAVKGDRIINMDSQAPNKIAVEWLDSGAFGNDITYIKPEQKFGNSRFDIYYERENGVKGFIEVKGVTLEEDGVARFPDAPTLRGVKHIYELIEAKKAGYEANVLFVIQMKGTCKFRPNDLTHKAFGDALRCAKESGVQIYAFDSVITPNSITIDQPIEVVL